MALTIFYSGCEIPSHRKLLSAEGVENVSMSYMGLRRRTTFKKPWLVENYFSPETNVFLDSGAHTINSSKTAEYTGDELADIANHYMSFIAQNIDHLTMVSEFDVKQLGFDWIQNMRDDFYEDLPPEKFMVIWHPETGTQELSRLCSRYKRVGVYETNLRNRDLTPTLNQLVSRYGVKLHGVGITKPDQMRAIKWDTLASHSWLSPSQFGDTQVWTGSELKRYPKPMKEEARARHRNLFTINGFDAEKIINDDREEVLRLAIWSWKQLEQSINSRKTKDVSFSNSNVVGKTTNVVAIRPDIELEHNVETEDTEVVTGAEIILKSEVDTHDNQLAEIIRVKRRSREEMKVLPVVSVTYKIEEKQDGTEVKTPILNIRSESMRICDSCILSTRCPGFEPGSNCVYNIPIEVRTKEQLKSLYDALVEMQTQRVMFMRMAEDLEGGYADPNLSNEIDRLRKLISDKADMEREGFSLMIEARGAQAEGGMISRLFGRDAGEKVQALPAPIKADNLLNTIDAEIVDK